MSFYTGKVVEFTYENYRGVVEIRRVVPRYIWHGTSPYYTGKQWFLRAVCLERQADRDFAWPNISNFSESEDQSLPWRAS